MLLDFLVGFFEILLDFLKTIDMNSPLVVGVDQAEILLDFLLDF